MYLVRAVPSLIVVASVALSIAGCGGGGGSAAPEATVAVAEADAGAARPDRAHPSAPAGAPSAGGLLVDVSGQVRRPGVYELGAGSRVHEAIAAAGGLRRGADVSGINRAAPVVDGQQVLVPARPEEGPGCTAAANAASAATTPSGSAAGAATDAGSVSINAGDAAALDALPGIGPVTAARIVDDRTANGPFASVDDLDRVPGIGAATIEELRGSATT